MSFKHQLIYIFATFFISACCMSTVLIIVSLGTTLGFSKLHLYLTLMTISMLLINWSVYIQGHRLFNSVKNYISSWISLVGGVIAWLGVILPHAIMIKHIIALILISIGMMLLIVGLIWSFFKQY